MKGLLFICLNSGILLSSCNEVPAPQESVSQSMETNNAQIKRQFITANQQLMQKENDEMDYYATSHKMAFVRTGSGIRYYVYETSAQGDSIKNDMVISMDYSVSLLDGTLCYSSEREGRRTFKVGQEEIESGIHKGVQYLKRGDKALIMIPSPLAHGLLGDFKKIPPQMPIVYDVIIY
ncbi:MAG: FKBP-type peptidyl-prolyl cis-trans isomerase [bacterium]|nr:FKBP-type peptidyl-prolyl cis-trans isomerase [bacterium]